MRNSFKQMCACWGIAWFLAIVMPSAYGQQNGTATHGVKSVRAVRSETAVTLDGSLDEPAWQDAPISLGFIQKDPQEGQPSSEKTEFRVVYNATTIYIGVICYDTDPTGIRANDRQRDSTFQNDDTLTLVLDTFHDHRNAFMFRTNPLGAQYDALVTDEGRELNANWDEKWETAAKITEAGWVAEFAIPFKSLRINEDGKGQIWGLDLSREIRRKNEQTYWNNFHRGFELQNVSQGGHLQGLENIDSGMKLRVKPYVLGGLSRSSNDFNKDWKDTSDVGMEVMKYRITPSLTADLTWNTDFAQTEVDDQQVNLDIFPLFFPEKREFFLEGAGIYDFGQIRNEATRDLTLFHSRRIGLTPGNLPVPITAGARVTGNVKGLTLGLLNVQTDREQDLGVPESNYSVARVKRNILARSFIGGFLLNRESGGTGDDFNRVYGMDATFVFHRFLTVSTLWAKSDEADKKLADKDWVSNGNVRWESDFLLAGMEFMFVEPNFRDDLGFTARRNMRRFTPQIGFNPRPKSGFIRQISTRAQFDYMTDRQWNLLAKRNHFTFRMEFQSGDSIGATPHYREERFARPRTLRERDVEPEPVKNPGVILRVPEIVVPPGVYGWWYTRISYNANPARRLSGSFSIEPSPGYFGGDLFEWSFSPRLKVSNNLSLNLQYTINNGTFDDAASGKVVEFQDHLLNFKVNYNFNNRWLTTTTIQYNNADSFSGVNFRLNYIFRPGDDFFLVYNEGRRMDDVYHGQKDRSIQAKLTYSFDY